MAFSGVSDGVLNTIGRTPVVQLKRLAPQGAADVFVKLEYFNPTGSYKDRMALAMIEGAEARGALRPGMRVVEYTGGSTGSSLAMVCAVKGYALRAAVLRRVRAREDPDDGGLRRGRGDRAERWRQGDARALRPVQGANRGDEG